MARKPSAGALPDDTPCRARLVMALCQNTDYLLLDEPLNNLDMRHAVEMMRLLRRTVDDLGRTAVLVLHDINFASVYSDHIVAMREGRVVCTGTPADVLSPERLRAVYDMDIDIHEIRGHRIGVSYG